MTNEDETFRRLKREPDFEKVQARMVEARRDAHEPGMEAEHRRLTQQAVEDAGWTMEEFIREGYRRKAEEDIAEWNK